MSNTTLEWILLIPIAVCVVAIVTFVSRRNRNDRASGSVRPVRARTVVICVLIAVAGVAVGEVLLH